METTLCYLIKEHQYLMLYRNKKENDVNHGKWIGVGGKMEDQESPEEGMIREVFEETGYTVRAHQYCGIVTFCYNGEEERMHLFTSNQFTGELNESCDEGELKWIDIAEISKLNLWQGDRIFLEMIQKNAPFFHLKLTYVHDELRTALMNGKEIYSNE